MLDSPQDPITEIIRLLRPKATLWRSVQAVAPWGLRFEARNDLLFALVGRESCLLLRAGLAPVELRAGDFALIHTRAAFHFASGLEAEPTPSDEVFASPDALSIRLGPDRPDSAETPVLVHGGRFVFDTANEQLLTALLPPLLHVPADAPGSPALRSLLQLNADELAHTRPAGAFVIARLMELILVEVLRSAATPATEPEADGQPAGLLAGLGDPMLAPALHGLHAKVAKPWTVAGLAHLCGLSRSAFAARFHRVIGRAPMDYLLEWRMVLARDELRRTDRRTISEIAFAIGFESASAFSTAFRRRHGMPPSEYVRQRSD